jgi:curved DNA-binding protein
VPVEFKDYYDVLGVAKTASAADIKKSYRRLAHQYHPDVAKDKVTGEEKFKELNEANEVLSDPDKRRQYDALGASWNHPERHNARKDGRSGGDFEEGSEFHFDGTGFSAFFEQFFGSRGRQTGGFRRTREDGIGGAAAQRGQDIEGDILVTLDELLRGSTRTISLQRTDPRTGQSSTQTLHVRIPSGVREGQRIRLAGKGKEGTGGAESGHVYLRVTLAQHPDFRVRGTDLYCDLPLAPWEAVLGATAQVRTLDGTVSLRIPASTMAEQQFRLRGKGLPSGQGTRGDMYATVSIEVPAHPTPEQTALWEQLAAQSKFNPRTRS